MSKSTRLFFLSLGAAALLLMIGCSNSPSDDELHKLQELQAQAKQLDEQVATQQRDNAALRNKMPKKTANFSSARLTRMRSGKRQV